MAKQLGITEDEPSKPKPTREVWTATYHNDKVPDADPMGDRRVQVLAPNFKRAALKAAKFSAQNPEWRILSLIYSPDTVI